MYLYNLTLQKSLAITHSVHGNFSGQSKVQEIVVSRGKTLDLLKPDLNTGKVHTLLSTEVFGVIRSLMSFRLTGGTKDYIIVGSDSGRIVVIEYNVSKNIFERIHLEIFGKSGCRRIVPGQYLAVDPKGRAVMIGAIEKQKLVYIFNRDSEAHLTISSPLEAHKANSFVYHMVAVDVGFENPIFACLEIDYEEADNDVTGEVASKTPQTLTFYELDLGLNHVVRKYSEPLDEHANMLISVPGGNDGPSGVLICSENYITYKNLGDQPDIRCPIPRRRNDLDDPDRGIIIISSATHKTKALFFFLLQSEQGDIFRLTLETDEDMVTEIRLKYFDTVSPAVSLNVLKSGFLFVASEFGNHNLYQITHLGEEDDEPEFSSAMPLEEGDTFFFAPRPLKNILLVDELESLAPIMCSNIQDLANEDTPQVYAACGRGPRSSLRVLRHGLEVSEMAVSELPGNPNAVWTVKRRSDDEHDAYIIVSFHNATLVLSIGDTVEEVTDSGFLGTTPTLVCSSLGDDSLLQIYPFGIRHIRSDRRVNEWKAPGSKKITRCATNSRQVVIALSSSSLSENVGNSQLVYFEMDSTGQLNEYTERKDLPSSVTSMTLASVPDSEQRSRFLAVGLTDSTVRVISLDPSDCLQPLAMQALPSDAGGGPESLCIAKMGGKSKTGNGEDGGGEDNKGNGEENAPDANSGQLYLSIGLKNGVLLRTVLDQVTGDLSDTRTRYLGSKPIKLFRVTQHGSEAVLAMTSRTWISYYYQNRFHLAPLSYESLDYAAGFSSEQCPEGIVAISSNTLRILALEKLGTVFNQTSIPISYTPRRFVMHNTVRSTIKSNNKALILIESDYNSYTEETKRQRKHQMAEEMRQAAGTDEEMEFAQEMADNFLKESLSEAVFGSPKAGPGQWASCIRVLDPVRAETSQLISLEQNEAAVSIALVRFAKNNANNDPSVVYCIVGVSVDHVLHNKSHNGGLLYTYRVGAGFPTSGSKFIPSTSLTLVHKTAVEEIPYAIAEFEGRALIGVGKWLRLYDIGKKKLLRKLENRNIPNTIVDIKTIGNRIFVSDIQESVFCVRYKRGDHQLQVFADDILPRWITTSCILDFHTVVVADKFGNVMILRMNNLDTSVSDPADCPDDDPTRGSNTTLWDFTRSAVMGLRSSKKLEVVACFYIGETVLSLQKTNLIPGGADSIVYTTLSGSVGTLLPLTSREDVDFFQHLEMHLRSEHLEYTLSGRDHLAYRSYYQPVKNVIDGDFCEQMFSCSLNSAKQKNIAQELDRTPAEIAKKLEDIRTRFAF